MLHLVCCANGKIVFVKLMLDLLRLRHLMLMCLLRMTPLNCFIRRELVLRMSRSALRLR